MGANISKTFIKKILEWLAVKFYCVLRKGRSGYDLLEVSLIMSEHISINVCRC